MEDTPEAKVEDTRLIILVICQKPQSRGQDGKISKKQIDFIVYLNPVPIIFKHDTTNPGDKVLAWTLWFQCKSTIIEWDVTQV